MLYLKGTHGTAYSLYEKIVKQGFRNDLGFKTRRGSGIYFWREGKHSKILAVCWWRFKKKRGHYKTCLNDQCTVIYASIEICNNSELVNLTNPKHKEGLILTAEKLRLDLNKQDHITKLYNYYCNTVENTGNCKVKVIEVQAPPPYDCNEYAPIKKVIGDPLIYVVKDQGCINIKKYEVCHD